MKLENFNDSVIHFKYLHIKPQNDNSYIIHPTPVAYYSIQFNDCDVEYCRANNIPCYCLNWPGGAIVANKGDLTYIHVVDHPDHFNIKFKHFLANKLKTLEVETIVSNNDILGANGHKFCGMMGKQLDHGYWLDAGHISINTNLDLIKDICLKPMEKTPQGLGEYGITSQMLEQWYLEFIRSFN